MSQVQQTRQRARIGRDLTDAERRQTEWDNHIEVLRIGQDIAEAVRINAEKQLMINDINYTRQLTDSMETFMDNIMLPNGTTIVDGSGVGISAPYAHFVEFGRGPGPVNIDAIKGWVMGKLGITGPENVNAVTSLVYWKILHKGIAPTHFFKRAIRMVTRRGILTKYRKERSPALTLWQRIWGTRRNRPRRSKTDIPKREMKLRRSKPRHDKKWDAFRPKPESEAGPI